MLLGQEGYRIPCTRRVFAPSLIERQTSSRSYEPTLRIVWREYDLAGRPLSPEREGYQSFHARCPSRYHSFSTPTIKPTHYIHIGLVTFLWANERCIIVSPLVLTIVIVESALQLVPKEIQSYTQIKQYAKRRQKNPDEVLLDRAFHHSAMQKLARKLGSGQVARMGRPDIVHGTLLQILETPLNWEQQLRVLIHTQDEQVITINPKIRLPKNYVRFVGLMEQLLVQKRVPESGDALMRVERRDLKQILKELGSDYRLGFSILGKPGLMRNVTKKATAFENPSAFIGGFPRGHFTENTRRFLDGIYCVDREPLDAWVVAGRFVYDFEWAIGVAQRRIDASSKQNG